ncbi:MAG: biotin transporter BioY [Alphaproteobacteria bacterium]|nr:biotin transporter BioY [Alphaproteobacteria bacterium]
MNKTVALQSTIASLIWPNRSSSLDMRIIRGVILAIIGSFVVAALAQISVPLWPVPITGQTFGVLIVGMALGSKLGMLSLTLYMLEGICGLPVFANFSSGPGVIVGPTGGYIIGFIFAAGAIGYLAERKWDRSILSTALAMLIGNIILYIPGLIWLGLFFAGLGKPDPLEASIVAGLFPFLIGDVLKLALAALLFPTAWRYILTK